MTWFFHGCEHAGWQGFALGLWATLATGCAVYNWRSARAWQRAFVLASSCRVDGDGE